MPPSYFLTFKGETPMLLNKKHTNVPLRSSQVVKGSKEFIRGSGFIALQLVS